MQLSKKQKATGVVAGIAQATTSLLSGLAVADTDKTWDIKTAIMYYSETDRVSAVEPVISATKTLAPEKTWNIKFVIDSLTGATPNGAVRSDDVQTFTTPSGNALYETPAGELPKESNFHENARVALSTQYSAPINDVWKYSSGLSFSREYDYLSIGVNGNIARDFNHHNTTVSAGLAFANDTIEPVGGVPRPLQAMLGQDDDSNKQGTDDSKTVSDVLLGVTQVLSPTWLMQVNYSLSQQSGYLTDPYKVVTRLDGTGSPVNYLYEARPDSRTKNSIFVRSKSHHGDNNILDLSYRYHTDDWGIDSHTIDFRFRWQMHAKHYLEPHLRYYQQAQADFYTQALDSTAAIPEFASADPRLGELIGTTVGFEYGYQFSSDKSLQVRLESYQQDGDDQVLPGNLDQRYEIFPDLDAVIFQIGYDFKF